MTLDVYVKNPCGVSSLPYWKTGRFPVPDHMKILHHSQFDERLLEEYSNDAYFRLFHSLRSLPDKTETPPLLLQTAPKTPETFARLAKLINDCYDRIQVAEQQIEDWTASKVYRQDLWILAVDPETNTLAGAGIADFDPEVKEGILEWIQALPAYRKQRIGRRLVTELLSRMKPFADFATVSGRMDNPCCPEHLYRSCGFTGTDTWHILSRKNKNDLQSVTYSEEKQEE